MHFSDSNESIKVILVNDYLWITPWYALSSSFLAIGCKLVAMLFIPFPNQK
ncbi:hypothetical protein SAMN05421863_100379 [Nitrosomonas communis]|uniref:Uncharacterized protein n=1 Tax=Nitrosomonas communis TaxID=44574 RepID=A0A1I4K2M7_9PROT|nr:hypothetical protein SAMN05421863_100379 [Nitrosomonas communis]